MEQLMSVTIDDRIRSVQSDYDADIYMYTGEIRSPHDEFLTEIVSARKNRQRNNTLLILRTLGGSPDAAYKICRNLQNSVPKGSDGKAIGSLKIYIPNECKSAGTLICVGADELIMSETAELGPLDVQLRRQDEVGERTSGLAPIQAFGTMMTQALDHFKDFFSKLRFDSELAFSTKIAADIATNITVGLLNPIYAQIDPIRVAEIERSLRIASEYGERLSKGKNLKEGALGKLLAGYPSHGFVIDKNEASELFTTVTAPSEHLEWLGQIFGTFTRDNFIGVKSPYVVALEPQQGPPEPPPQTEEQNDGTEGTTVQD